MTDFLDAGIYYDVPVDRYFADPCPEPSLTQSIAKIILEHSPAHARICHPRLNPDWKADDDKRFDIGNIAHSLMLGRGKQIDVLDFEDWRTKAAQQAREQAAKEGRLAVLRKHFDQANAMQQAALTQLANMGLIHHWEDDAGHAEAVLAWQDNGIWCRSMVDWLTTDLRLAWDFKSTAMSAAPHVVGRYGLNLGWDVQAAMILRGLDAVDPDGAGRRKFRFVCQESDPPYALTVCEMSETWLTMGRKKIDYALAKWAHCLRTKTWPAYPTSVILPDYPGFAESQWLEREIEEAERERHPMMRHDAPLDILMAG